MRIKCNETGRTTTVRFNEFNDFDVVDAMTRLIRRETEYRTGAYYASQYVDGNNRQDFRADERCRRAEICRPCGNLTERTGVFRTFEEI